METTFLREFIIFSKHLSYSKAAKELHISQPALRSHIKSLEHEMGTPLFIRQEGRLELSLAGKLCLSSARNIVDLADTLVSECKDMSSRSVSVLAGTIGYPPFEKLLAAAREKLRKDSPECIIDLRFATSTHANISTIVDRKADITLLPRLKYIDDPIDPSRLKIPPSIEAHFLCSEACSFWMTSSNPLFGRDDLTLKDFSGQSLLLGNTDNMLNAGEKFSRLFEEEMVDIQIDHQPFASYNDYVFSVCLDAFGIMIEALHPNLKKHDDRRVFQITEFPMRYDLFVVYDRSTFSEKGCSYLEELKNLVEGFSSITQ